MGPLLTFVHGCLGHLQEHRTNLTFKLLAYLTRSFELIAYASNKEMVS